MAVSSTMRVSPWNSVRNGPIVVSQVVPMGLTVLVEPTPLSTHAKRPGPLAEPAVSVRQMSAAFGRRALKKARLVAKDARMPMVTTPAMMLITSATLTNVRLFAFVRCPRVRMAQCPRRKPVAIPAAVFLGPTVASPFDASPMTTVQPVNDVMQGVAYPVFARKTLIPSVAPMVVPIPMHVQPDVRGSTSSTMVHAKNAKHVVVSWTRCAPKARSVSMCPRITAIRPTDGLLIARGFVSLPGPMRVRTIPIAKLGSGVVSVKITGRAAACLISSKANHVTDSSCRGPAKNVIQAYGAPT